MAFMAFVASRKDELLELGELGELALAWITFFIAYSTIYGMSVFAFLFYFCRRTTGAESSDILRRRPNELLESHDGS